MVAGTALALAIDEVVLPISLRSIPTGYLLAGVFSIATASLGQRTLAMYERLADLRTLLTLEAVTVGVAAVLLLGSRLVAGPVTGLPSAVTFGALGLLAGHLLASLAEVVVASVAIVFLFLAGGTLASSVDDLASHWAANLTLCGLMLAARIAHLVAFRGRTRATVPD